MQGKQVSGNKCILVTNFKCQMNYDHLCVSKNSKLGYTNLIKSSVKPKLHTVRYNLMQGSINIYYLCSLANHIDILHVVKYASGAGN